VAELADYLGLRAPAARAQFRGILARPDVPAGRRQVDFVPVETLLCLAASFVVDHSRFGSGTAHRAPEPVQLLARLFRRPPSSVLAKMANLDGTRSHGAKWDRLASMVLREQPSRFSEIYRLLLSAARDTGVGPDRLPDFLDLESGKDLELLGQEELVTSVVEAELRRRLAAWREASGGLTREDTERILLASVRVGQHVFASRVLHNCGYRCVFCGLSPRPFGGTRMLLASHIKPWRDSDPRERLDHRNGVAACPTHDVAFDTGLLTVNGGLRIHVADRLARTAAAEDVAGYYFRKPPLGERLLLPEGADPPGAAYLRWHRDRVFAA
jgi:putative restriction endonuclease